MNGATFFTGEHDAQGHAILSLAGLAIVRDCINAQIAGRQLPGVSIRQLSPFDLDARFTITEPFAPGERAFELKFGSALMPSTVLLVAVEMAGAEQVTASWNALLAAISEIEASLGDVEDVAADLAHRPRQIDMEAPADLHASSRNANAACDRIRAITSDPRNWRPISQQAQLYAVAETLHAEVVA